MKKFLAVLLMLSLILAMLIVPTAAEDAVSPPSTTSTASLSARTVTA